MQYKQVGTFITMGLECSVCYINGDEPYILIGTTEFLFSFKAGEYMNFLFSFNQAFSKYTTWLSTAQEYGVENHEKIIETISTIPSITTIFPNKFCKLPSFYKFIVKNNECYFKLCSGNQSIPFKSLNLKLTIPPLIKKAYALSINVDELFH